MVRMQKQLRTMFALVVPLLAHLLLEVQELAV